MVFGPFADHFSLLRWSFRQRRLVKGLATPPPQIASCCHDWVVCGYLHCVRSWTALFQVITFVHLSSLFGLQTEVFNRVIYSK